VSAGKRGTQRAACVAAHQLQDLFAALPGAGLLTSRVSPPGSAAVRTKALLLRS